jgi:hypothetical protein
MKKKILKTWIINDSIDLAKLYLTEETNVFIYSNIELNKSLGLFFKSFEIPFISIKDKQVKCDYAYFGNSVNFQNLYVIAGIIKSYGYSKIYYNPNLNNEINIGSTKRNNSLQKKCYLEIDLILALPFYTEINDIVAVFNKLFYKKNQKVDVIEFGLKSGLISQDDFHKYYNAGTYDDNIEDYKSYNTDDEDNDDSHIESNVSDHYDPYEKFNWGGLNGEEANTAYWNCD